MMVRTFIDALWPLQSVATTSAPPLPRTSHLRLAED
jgi:hypothetical protein